MEVFTGAGCGINDFEMTVTTVAAEITKSPMPGRKSLTLQNRGDDSVFVGSRGVAVGQGFELGSGESMSFDYGEGIHLWAVTSNDQTSGSALWVIEAA